MDGEADKALAVTASALVARLAVLGVCKPRSRRLRPAAAIPPDLMAMLREHKA